MRGTSLWRTPTLNYIHESSKNFFDVTTGSSNAFPINNLNIYINFRKNLKPDSWFLLLFLFSSPGCLWTGVSNNSNRRSFIYKEKQWGCPLHDATKRTHIYIKYICVYILFICLHQAEDNLFVSLYESTTLLLSA